MDCLAASGTQAVNHVGGRYAPTFTRNRTSFQPIPNTDYASYLKQFAHELISIFLDMAGTNKTFAHLTDFCYMIRVPTNTLALSDGGAALAEKNALVAELLTVTTGRCETLTGWSRSEIYRRLADGSLRARKQGSKTLIEWASVLEHHETLPPAQFGPARRLAA
jgi:hypothetical protein